MSNNSDTKEKNTNQIDLLDVLISLAKHKLFIFKVVFTISVIALIISLIWPNTYRSTATFLPPKQVSIMPGGLGGVLGSALGGLGMQSTQLNAEAVLNVLKSRTIREQIIEKFDLAEVYKQDIMEFLLEDVEKKTRIDITREGGFGFSPLVYIELSYDDREPWRAQEIVKFYLAKLDSTVHSINRRYAENSFDMINMRYLQNLQDLERAELELKEFQQEYGVFEVEEQAKMLIQNIAQLKSAKIELDVKINVLRQTVSDNQADLQNLMRTRAELQRQIDNLVKQSDESATEYAFFALSEAPEIGLQYLRLFREVMIQSKVLEVIYPQLQIQETMLHTSSPNIQIVDEASYPTYKVAPKRAFIVLGGMLFGIFLSLTIVFYREIVDKGKESDSEQYRKINELISHLSFRKKESEA